MAVFEPFLRGRGRAAVGLAAILGCAVWIVPLSAADPGEVEAPITTGLVAALIGETIPEPPPGFRTTLETLAALSLGKVPAVNLRTRLPEANVEKDLVYARYDDLELTLDVYKPDQTRGPTPGLVLIHGGAWIGGKKEDYAFYGSKFAEWGYTAVSINYRKAPQHRFPACVQDAKAAVRWLRANASRLNVDPQRIGVVGGSAGGHLALMVGYADGSPLFEGQGGHADVSSQVACVVAIYPPTDLSTITPNIQQADGNSSPLISGFLGGTYDQIPETYKLASPLHHLTDDDPPTLLLHGDIDGLVPVAQSDLLAERLNELNIPYVYDRLPGWPHAMDHSKPVNDRCLFFMERFLKNTLQLETALLEQP